MQLILIKILVREILKELTYVLSPAVFTRELSESRGTDANHRLRFDRRYQFHLKIPVRDILKLK
jgi:hypothetical protein